MWLVHGVVYLAIICSLASAQIIHQPAAHLPDVGGERMALDMGFSLPDMSSVFGFDVPKDALLGPEQRAVPRRHASATSPPTGVRFYAESAYAAMPDAHRLLTGTLILAACLSVVACGVIPALFLPKETGQQLHESLAHKHLNTLLAFSVGTLLGDVFLHVLPEAWASMPEDSSYSSLGMATIAGLLICFLVEKCCAQTEASQHKAAAIMNLIANLVDNFTHGLAVTSSFFISVQFGLLTTLAILLHEIPHEISDFAILLRADFDRWSAVKAQGTEAVSLGQTGISLHTLTKVLLMTASGGVFGACVALGAQVTTVHACSHILAFTAGGFINIALVQVLPELLHKRHTRREHIKQLLAIVFGIALMAAVNSFHYGSI